MTMYSFYDGLNKVIISQQTDGWKYEVFDGSTCIGKVQGYKTSESAEGMARFLLAEIRKENKLARQLYAASR